MKCEQTNSFTLIRQLLTDDLSPENTVFPVCKLVSSAMSPIPGDAGGEGADHQDAVEQADLAGAVQEQS